MRRSIGTAVSGIVLATALVAVPGFSNADTIRYDDGGFGSVQQSLSGLGYDTSGPSIESTAETFIVPGTSGGATRLDFTYIRDTGSYNFSFGVFDRGEVTADPVSDRQNWALQALGAATMVFDDRETNVGATASVDVAAGTDLGLFLIPNDTLDAVLDNPAAFYGGNRPDPLFSVSDANPGGFDQLMVFEAGGLTTFAFEDLSRAGSSDEDFTDLVITMTSTPFYGDSVAQSAVAATEIAEPPALAILITAGLAFAWLRGAATRLTDIPADHGVAKTPALPVWLDGLAARHGNQTALKSGETSLSFEGLSERARSIAAGMLQHGIGPGDRVAVWMVNDPDWLAVFLACTRVGVIVVAVNTRFRVTELADMLERTQPRAIFYRAGLGSVNFSELIRASIARVNGPSVMEIVAGPAGPDVLAGALPLEDLLVRSGLPEFPDPAPDDGAIMFATSGTTSAPKFVLHSHRSIVDHAVDVSSDFFMTDPDSTVLQALPYCGVFGFCQAMAALAAGRPSIIMDIFDPVGAGRLIADERVTHFNATDEMLSAIVQVSSPEMRASLRLIGAASFNRGPETLATLAADHGLPIVGLYGMSEVQALYARRDLHDPPASRFHGGGRPVSRVAEIRVRDPESGELLAAGKSGELELRGPSLLKTYFGDVAATGTAMTEDGFVRTGDLGFLEEDGSFTFESRMGDALRLGGFLVNPDEISGFIETIEGIVACVVVGVRAEGRQRAAAFVKTREPAVIDPQSVIDRCKGGLAPFKIPVIVHALQEFPVADGPNGVKIQRGELRRLAIALTEQ